MTSTSRRGRQRKEREVVREQIPVSTAKVILERRGPLVEAAHMHLYWFPPWTYLTPRLDWLQEVVVNCYTQGLMDGVFQVAPQLKNGAVSEKS